MHGAVGVGIGHAGNGGRHARRAIHHAVDRAAGQLDRQLVACRDGVISGRKTECVVAQSGRPRNCQRIDVHTCGFNTALPGTRHADGGVAAQSGCSCFAIDPTHIGHPSVSCSVTLTCKFAIAVGSDQQRRWGDTAGVGIQACQCVVGSIST